jgi:hypothetical protein
MRITHLSVVNDGAFPSAWIKPRPCPGPCRHALASAACIALGARRNTRFDSQAFQDWAKRNPAPVMSYREMQATLRGFA